MTITVNNMALAKPPYIAMVPVDINYGGGQASLHAVWSTSSGDADVFWMSGDWTNHFDFTAIDITAQRTQILGMVLINDATAGDVTVSVTVTDGAGYSETETAVITVTPVPTSLSAGPDQVLPTGSTSASLIGTKTNLPTVVGTRVTPATIVAQVAAAVDGDTIVMAGGNYPVELDVSAKNLSFTTEPGDWQNGKPAIFTSTTGSMDNSINYSLRVDNVSAGHVSGAMFKSVRGGAFRVDNSTGYDVDHLYSLGTGQANALVSFESSGIHFRDAVTGAIDDSLNGESGNGLTIIDSPAGSGNIIERLLSMGMTDDLDMWGSQGVTLSDFIIGEVGKFISGDGIGLKLGGRAGASGDNHAARILIVNPEEIGLVTNDISPLAPFTATNVTVTGELARGRDYYSDGNMLTLSNSIGRGSPPDPNYNLAGSVNNSWDIGAGNASEFKYSSSAATYQDVFNTTLGDPVDIAAAGIGAKSSGVTAHNELPEIYGNEVLWAQVSGPTVIITGGSTLGPTVSGLTDNNAYTFRLATPGNVQTDDVVITIGTPTVTATAVDDDLGVVTAGVTTTIDVSTNDTLCNVGLTTYELVAGSVTGGTAIKV